MSIYVDIEKTKGSFFLKAAFEVENETLALLGASGCGKSMTLKCIAGMEKPDKGKIIVDGITLFDSEKKINLTPQERQTGLMFQNYALFPNMTVVENIAAGAKREKDSKKRKEMTAAMIESFGLSKLRHHYPSQLSGGQQQRVALARILVSNPRILLLDEPFSALDSHLRFQMEREVREVIREFNKSVLLVSHDRDEVFRMSDRIAVMHDGRIEAFGTRAEVFENPQTCAGARLTGCKNVSVAKVIDEHHVEAMDWGITVEVDHVVEGMTAVGIRMHDICSGNGKNMVECQVVEEVENPFSYTIMLKPYGKQTVNPIGWEMNKDVWQKLRGDKQIISLPVGAILCLKE